MKISYLGHSCFRLTGKNGITVLTDPYTRVGYELPKGLCADVVTVSHGHFDHNYVTAVKSDLVISESEEYALPDVRIIGIDSWHDPKQGVLRGANVIYKIVMEGITVCHFGDLGEEFSATLVEKIGKVDILLLPIGGTYTIDAVQAKAYADAISPKTVIPMHYRPSDGVLDITTAQPFLNQYGEGEVCEIRNGELEIMPEELTEVKKIIYMERKKGND